MSTRSLLNRTSRKKRDTMLTYTNTILGADSGSTDYHVGPAELSNNKLYMFAWMPTARGLSFGTTLNTITNDAQRTASTCYMRGLKECVTFNTFSNEPVKWRRLCFTLKDKTLNSTQNDVNRLYTEVTQAETGWVRLVNNVLGSLLGTNIESMLFKGRVGVDWQDQFTAPTDNRRVTVKYDKTRVVNPGSNGGKANTFNIWHGMNRNLVYDDDELGETKTSNLTSVSSKAGMGDYYVIDYIAAYSPNEADNDLVVRFAPEATLYWHER